jgi:hypothetical protein
MFCMTLVAQCLNQLRQRVALPGRMGFKFVGILTFKWPAFEMRRQVIKPYKIF